MTQSLRPLRPYGNLALPLGFTRFVACVAGPQFYGGPDLQRAGFWRARGGILPRANLVPRVCLFAGSTT